MKIEYPAEQTVSIWVGTFSTENAFDRSIDEEVGSRLDLKVPIESICEVTFESQHIGVRKLLEGFSGWETFAESAVSASRDRGIENANAALVCYYLKCEDGPSMWGQLHFLGSFPGQDVQS